LTIDARATVTGLAADAHRLAIGGGGFKLNVEDAAASGDAVVSYNSARGLSYEGTLAADLSGVTATIGARGSPLFLRLARASEGALSLDGIGEGAYSGHGRIRALVEEASLRLPNGADVSFARGARADITLDAFAQTEGADFPTLRGSIVVRGHLRGRIPAGGLRVGNVTITRVGDTSTEVEIRIARVTLSARGDLGLSGIDAVINASATTLDGVVGSS